MSSSPNQIFELELLNTPNRRRHLSSIDESQISEFHSANESNGEIFLVKRKHSAGSLFSIESSSTIFGDLQVARSMFVVRRESTSKNGDEEIETNRSCSSSNNECQTFGSLELADMKFIEIVETFLRNGFDLVKTNGAFDENEVLCQTLLFSRNQQSSTKVCARNRVH